MAPLVIGTHDGCFHCDEVLACYLLQKLPEYKDAKIVRSRNQSVLDECDIVVDVGGVYDHSKKRYDHHMRSFTHSLSTLRKSHTSTIKLSSAGLVYHHYGEDILRNMTEKLINKELVNKLFDYVYDHFLQEIDAIDNGELMFPEMEGHKPRYHITTNLSHRVGNLHPAWNDDQSPKSFDRQFFKAMEIVGAEFDQVVFKFTNIWWPARELVEKAVDDRFKVHSSGHVIEVPICPWMQHVYDIENINKLGDDIKFAIWNDNNHWRVRALNIASGSFDLRLPLHSAWRGLRDGQLQEISGVADATFVHAVGFIGGAGSRNGALALALKTLEYAASQNGE